MTHYPVPVAQRCTTCRATRPIADFNRLAASDTGYRLECRSCNNERDRRRYQRDRAWYFDRNDRRRARKMNAESDGHTRADMMNAWDANGSYACVYCCGPAETHDHIVPLSKGGADTLTNIVPACARCNSSKGARDPWEWICERFPKAAALMWRLA